MRNSLFNCLTIMVVAFVAITSCKPPQKQNINYLTDKRDSSHTLILQNYDTKIRPGDKLAVAVSALNPTAAQIYNPAPVASGSGSAAGAAGGASGGNVTVDMNGFVLYPQLGMIKAAGLTRNEFRDTLLRRLSGYLADPVVSVDFANFKITMLGAVNHQGTVPVPDGHITILEALGQAGDVSVDAQRDSVLVVREVNGKREFGVVNLLSNEMFKSPYYTLQQNDVVYVPLNRKKALISEKDDRRANIQTITSVASVAATLLVLLINIFKK